MKKQETSLTFLNQFLPEGAFDQVAPFFRTHVIHLTLTHDRKSVLGDYRNPSPDTPYHRISVNTTLNRYSFLITLLHELAHMFTYIQHHNRVAPHGQEWKAQFRQVLIPFLGKKFFPADVERALLAYLQNPAASTCTDKNLYKALYRYDDRRPGYTLVDDIAVNQFFETEDGQVYQAVEKLRTRMRCKNIKSGKFYFFPGIAEVRVQAAKRQ